MRVKKVAEDSPDEIARDPFLSDAVGDLPNQGPVLDKCLGEISTTVSKAYRKLSGGDLP